MLHLPQDGTHLHKLSPKGRTTQEEEKNIPIHAVEDDEKRT